MLTSAQVLGKFAAELEFPDIPAPVVERAKDCIIDAVAAATFGTQFPWSRMVADYAWRYGRGGPCTIIGFDGTRVHAPYAAMANGVLVHAFELDGGRDPSSGVHPGAAMLPAILAACEETGADGRTAIAAFVAGCEILFRIGMTAHHRPEIVGFHQPSLVGAYGAAVATGRVYGLDGQQLAHAIGIAGSLSCGLLAFTKAKHGGMVKRLHLGRAAESGILAARLAASGYAGPETVLEGRFGFLDAYCSDDTGRHAPLTADIGRNWETLRISIKRYACHMFAHTPVHALRELMLEHAFRGTDVAGILVEGNPTLPTHHNITEPRDITQAQYSVPFCVALALFRNPEDPKSFDTGALEDPDIRAACRDVELRVLAQGRTTKSSRVTVRLKDGREFTRACEWFKGMPDHPLSRAELRAKFMLLTASMGEPADAQLFARLERIESAPKFSLE